MGAYPVDAGDHPGVAAVSGAVENTHTEKRDLLGHAEGPAPDGAGDMGPVTVAVLAVAPEGVVDISGPSTEIGVTGRDAGVDDVGTHVPRGGRVRITAGQRQPALVHPVEPVQSAACGNGLRGEGLEVSAHRRDLVLLDAADLW